MRINIRILSIITITFLTLNLACEKDSPPPNSYDFAGIVATDNQGAILGVWGNDDGDWESEEEWTNEETSLLNFPDTISLDNTFIEDTTGWNSGTGIPPLEPQNQIFAYPNPAQYMITFRGNAIGNVKFKLVIVDEQFKPLFEYACKSDSFVLSLDLSDTTMFVNEEIYRLYYSLSVTDSLNFFKGHGDFLICREDELLKCLESVP